MAPKLCFWKKKIEKSIFFCQMNLDILDQKLTTVVITGFVITTAEM